MQLSRWTRLSNLLKQDNVGDEANEMRSDIKRSPEIDGMIDVEELSLTDPEDLHPPSVHKKCHNKSPRDFVAI